jgi:sialidase-1
LKLFPKSSIRFLAAGAIALSALLAPAVSARIIEYPFSTDLFVRGTNDNFLYRIPALTVTTKGTLIAVCDGRRERGDDLPNNIDLVMRRSFDSGTTWTPQQRIMDYPGAEGAGDASLLTDRKTGTVWCLYAYGPEGIGSRESQPGFEGPTLQLKLIRSEDDGITWSEPISINRQVKNPAWSAIWGSPGHGFQDRSNRLYFPVNVLSGTCFSYLIYSDNQGESWSMSSPMAETTNESMVVELSDGTLMANLRGSTGTLQRGVTTSHDRGQTWSPLVLEEVLVEPECQASLIVYSSTADGDSRNRMLFANPASANARVNMTVRLSYDEGKTWPVSKLIYPGKSAYSTLVKLPDGHIGMFYEHGAIHDTDQLSFVRFSMDWLTDGKDSGR